jgi:hypothetical protein
MSATPRNLLLIVVPLVSTDPNIGFRDRLSAALGVLNPGLGGLCLDADSASGSRTSL